MNKVLVVAVHPDDETLGAGGTLLKHKQQGDSIYWLTLTGISETLGYEKSKVLQRNQELKIVSEMFGFSDVFHLNFPTTKLDEVSTSELISTISDVIKKIAPNILYIPFFQDVHSDHRIAFEAVYSCTKVFRYPFIKRILMMETVSETEFAPSIAGMSFIPNTFVDITEFIEKKLEILNVYESEMGEHPFPRNNENISSLAMTRGATAGCKYAESFMLLKDIL